jgi:hypothetical protein
MRKTLIVTALGPIEEVLRAATAGNFARQQTG